MASHEGSTLCFECFRRNREERRAGRHGDDVAAPPEAHHTLPFGAPAIKPALTDRQIAHRRRMLECLVNAGGERAKVRRFDTRVEVRVQK